MCVCVYVCVCAMGIGCQKTHTKTEEFVSAQGLCGSYGLQVPIIIISIDVLVDDKLVLEARAGTTAATNKPKHSVFLADIQYTTVYI